MQLRPVVSTGGAACLAALILAAAIPVRGQSAYSPPRTPWGDPDLQGIWTNFTTTSLSVEAPGGPRPRLMGGTGDCIPRGTTRTETNDPGGHPLHWFEITLGGPGGRAGLVVEPKSGHLPALTPWADQRIDDICRRIFDSYEYLDPWVRCISRGVPASMFPSAYNNAYQILQMPGYVVIYYEMIHDARIIPLDGRPRAGSDIRLWMGNSRGRWEGDTLVVEATNFHDRGAVRGHPHSEQLRVVERFTRLGPDRLAYEATVTDPKVWTTPWKAAIDLDRDDDYQMFEYACHEGNLAVENILSGARMEEAGQR